MRILALIQYAVFLFYLWLFFFVLKKNRKAAINRVCALIVGCFAVWSLCGIFFYQSTTLAQAVLYANLSALGWIAVAACFFWYALLLTDKKKILAQWYFYLLNFGIPLFFACIQWLGLLARITPHPVFGWTVRLPQNAWAWLFNGYYLVLIISALGICFVFSRQTRFLYLQKQILFITHTGLIAFILGTVDTLIFPLFKMDRIPMFGTVSGLIWAGGVAYAITEFKRIELTPAYAASNIVATMADALFIIDADGFVSEANRAALILSGCREAEIVGRKAELFFPEVFPLLKYSEWDVLFRGDHLNNSRTTLQNKSGASVPVNLTVSVMRDKTRNIIGMVAVVRDLSEIIRLQEKERALITEQTRTEALREQAQELQTACDRLNATREMLLQSEKMAAIGQLAGGVAHEINNPISVILGFARSIVQRIEDADPLCLPLRSIEREALRCGKLVEDLLTFARTGSRQFEQADINRLIENTLSLVEAQARVRDISITRTYGTGLPPVALNRNQVQQVIVNICNNALDAMPGGGIIAITTKQIADDRIVFTIGDTGRGIPVSIRQRIFEPFFTTKDVGKGSGLGLSLCYEIVRQHNGSISVESTEGIGTAFSVELPVRQEPL